MLRTLLRDRIQRMVNEAAARLPAPPPKTDQPRLWDELLLPAKPGEENLRFPDTDGSERWGDDPIPMPPETVWRRVGVSPELFLRSGKQCKDDMLLFLEENGVHYRGFQRVFEWGAGCGRVTRHFYQEAQSQEYWASDIHVESMEWCKQHLNPPMRFFSNLVLPILPFESGYFDFVFAVSVFTHVIEAADLWLLELRRIVRPGGWALFSFHDEGCWARMFEVDEIRKNMGFRVSVSPDDLTDKVLVYNRYDAVPQVFHPTGYIRRAWGAYWKVVALKSRALDHWQAMVLLQKV